MTFHLLWLFIYLITVGQPYVIESDEDEDSDHDTSHPPAACSTQLSQPATGSRPHNSADQEDRISVMFNQPYRFNSEKHKQLCNAVALYILEEGLPVFTVERRGFQKMLQAFDKRLVFWVSMLQSCCNPFQDLVHQTITQHPWFWAADLLSIH